jgi:hypothetical protein
MVGVRVVVSVCIMVDVAVSVLGLEVTLKVVDGIVGDWINGLGDGVETGAAEGTGTVKPLQAESARRRIISIRRFMATWANCILN